MIIIDSEHTDSESTVELVALSSKLTWISSNPLLVSGSVFFSIPRLLAIDLQMTATEYFEEALKEKLTKDKAKQK